VYRIAKPQSALLTRIESFDPNSNYQAYPSLVPTYQV